MEAGFENNLLCQLHRVAYRQDENFLTEAFCHLLRHLLAQEPACGVTVLSFMTRGRLTFDVDHAQSIEIRTQVTESLGRPDIEIRSVDQLAYVEVKLESLTDEDQLVRYRRQLMDSGMASTALVLLTRYPTGLARINALEVCHRRWHEIAQFLDAASDALACPESAFIVKQFLTFLHFKGMSVERVGWELGPGIRAYRALIAMLGEALGNRRSQRVGGQAWIGYHCDDKQFWVGVFYDSPEIVRFETKNLSIANDAASRAGFGTVELDESAAGGRKWTHVLPLDSEDVHFYARSRESQLLCLEEFLQKCVHALPLIAAGD